MRLPLINTEFDSSVTPIQGVPQDLGRVMLNICNNAFYAVNDKKNNLPAEMHSYQPSITLTTKKNNGSIDIIITDNGAGIPHQLRGKIFQPFFTTKPTGQGTGLGLSLSYDIIKGYNGNLTVHSIEGRETTFIVTLPV